MQNDNLWKIVIVNNKIAFNYLREDYGKKNKPICCRNFEGKKNPDSRQQVQSILYKTQIFFVQNVLIFNIARIKIFISNNSNSRCPTFEIYTHLSKDVTFKLEGGVMILKRDG